MNIEILYHNKDLTRIDVNPNGNFIDLRSANRYEIKSGDFLMIDLGISVKLPDGYWAQVVPRSSLFKNHGLIMTNSFGVIDTSYCGNDDIWKMPVYATRDTVIEFDERICQFRLVADSEPATFIEVDDLHTENRGGFGSSGRM